MAATNAIKTYLREVIGFSDGEEGTLKANAMITEGLDSFKSLVDFNKQDIKSLCSSIRKPGGLIEDPNDPERRIQNLGVSIQAIAES